MSEVMTKEQVLAKIGAKDFRSIGADQIMSFVSSIPDMDKEVAMECIKQFPYFKECAENIAFKYNELCSDFLHDNKLTEKQIEAHQKVIDIHEKRIELFGKEMSHEEYLEIMTLIADEADKISEEVEKQQERKMWIMKFSGAVASVALAATSAVIGAKLKLPKL